MKLNLREKEKKNFKNLLDLNRQKLERSRQKNRENFLSKLN
jgi:hypothetical protein